MEDESEAWHIWFDQIVDHLCDKSNTYLNYQYKPLITHPGILMFIII